MGAAVQQRLLILSRLLAGVFAAAALFHVVAVVHPIGNSASPVRHAVFVAINGFFAVAFVRPRPWLVWPVAAFVLHQGYGHGVDAWTAWQAGRLDVQSLGTLLALPLIGYSAIRARIPSRIVLDDSGEG